MEQENCSLKGLCFKCQRKGHHASSCSFPSEPPKPGHSEPRPTENLLTDETLELLETEESDNEEIPHTSPLADSVDQIFSKVPRRRSIMTISPVLVSLSPKLMRIPVQLITLLNTLKVVDSSALVDSGADISCIDWQFVRKNKLPTEKLASPIAIRNVDQTVNKTGAIRYTCTLYTNIEGIA